MGDESDWKSVGDNSGAIGASFTGDEESLMEDMDENWKRRRTTGGGRH